MSLESAAQNNGKEKQNRKRKFEKDMLVSGFHECLGDLGEGNSIYALESAWGYYKNLNYLEKNIVRSYIARDGELDFIGFLQKIANYRPMCGIADVVGQMMLVDEVNEEFGEIGQVIEKLPGLKFKLNLKMLKSRL